MLLSNWQRRIKGNCHHWYRGAFWWWWFLFFFSPKNSNHKCALWIPLLLQFSKSLAPVNFQYQNYICIWLLQAKYSECKTDNTWFDFWKYNYHGTVSVGAHDSHQGPQQLSSKNLKAHNQLSLGIMAPLWFRKQVVRRPSVMREDTSNSLRMGKDASAYITFVLWAALISLLPLLIKILQNWQPREESALRITAKWYQ